VIRVAVLAATALLAAAGLPLLRQQQPQIHPRASEGGSFDSDLTLLQQQLPQLHPHVDMQAWDARSAIATVTRAYSRSTR
jgi:hypothetical protein